MKKSSFAWAIITIFMVLVALFFGLRPKGGALTNDAHWLTDKKGIRFSGRGMAMVENLEEEWGDRKPASFTIEMIVTPAKEDLQGFNPLIVMHDGADNRQLVIWQYRYSLIVMNGDDYDYKQRRPRVVARDIFSSQQTHYVAVASGRQGTRLYVDGVLADVKRDMRLTIPDSRSELRLVVGNSVHATHGWRGVIHGMAITAMDLGDESILQRCRQWAEGGSFDSIRSDLSLRLFPFNTSPNDVLWSSENGHRIKQHSGIVCSHR